MSHGNFRLVHGAGLLSYQKQVHAGKIRPYNAFSFLCFCIEGSDLVGPLLSRGVQASISSSLLGIVY